MQSMQSLWIVWNAGSAHELNECGIPKFGCSDCSCTSHLFYRQGDPKQEILAAFRELQLDPVIKTIINAQV